MIGLFLLISVVLLLLIVGLAKYSFCYGRLIRQAKMEIGRAYEKEERDHWRRELLALKLSVLPGINHDRAKRICQGAYRERHSA